MWVQCGRGNKMMVVEGDHCNKMMVIQVVPTASPLQIMDKDWINMAAGTQ
jgi:hypothetical protein